MTLSPHAVEVVDSFEFTPTRGKGGNLPKTVKVAITIGLGSNGNVYVGVDRPGKPHEVCGAMHKGVDAAVNDALEIIRAVLYKGLDGAAQLPTD